MRSLLTVSFIIILNFFLKKISGNELYCIYNYNTTVNLKELEKRCDTIIWRFGSERYDPEVCDKAAALIQETPNATVS